MSFVLNKTRLAIRQTVCEFFRKTNGESAVFLSVPKSHRHAHIFDRESPRLCVNLRISHHTFGRAAPSAPLAFENRFKRCVFAQASGVAGPQKQHFQKERTKPDWCTKREKWSRQ